MTTTTQTYRVTGMSCDHCVRAVTAEVSAIEGVSDVHVDVASGRVRVTAGQEVSTGAMRDAIEEAGYSLAG